MHRRSSRTSDEEMPRLYVGRLPSRIGDRDIERLFKGYGRLREINLKNGYGFVVSVSGPSPRRAILFRNITTNWFIKS